MTRAKWVDHSFDFFENKSYSLFLRVGFASFWRENCIVLSIAFKKQKRANRSFEREWREQIAVGALNQKSKKRDSLSSLFTKYDLRKTKEGIPNPACLENNFKITEKNKEKLQNSQKKKNIVQCSFDFCGYLYF